MVAEINLRTALGHMNVWELAHRLASRCTWPEPLSPNGPQTDNNTQKETKGEEGGFAQKLVCAHSCH